MGDDRDCNLHFVHIRYRTTRACKEWSTTLRASSISDAEQRAKSELRAVDRQVRRFDAVTCAEPAQSLPWDANSGLKLC